MCKRRGGGVATTSSSEHSHSAATDDSALMLGHWAMRPYPAALLLASLKMEGRCLTDALPLEVSKRGACARRKRCEQQRIEKGLSKAHVCRGAFRQQQTMDRATT